MIKEIAPPADAPTHIEGPLYYDERTCWFYLKVGDVYIPTLPKTGYHRMSTTARKLFYEEFTRLER